MKISFIGCGKMGGGIAERLAPDHDIALFDKRPEQSKALADKIGAICCTNASEAISHGELIILAVKPQDLERLAQSLHQEFNKEQLLVSVLAGVTTHTLQKSFPGTPILRIMPNLAVLHGQGVTGLADTENLPQVFKDKAQKAFSNLGSLYWFPESQIDALCALTSSGPAFLFVMMESIIDAGITMGFTSEVAKELTLQLFQDAVTMVKKSNKHPGELKWEIASPSGTTIYGIKELEDHSVRSGIINTFLAAYFRAKEL